MEKQTGYVTRLELVQTQQDLKKEVNGKIETVDGKVDNLRDMVLPLVESNNQVAKNTERMANSLDAFTTEQRKTNGSIYNKINSHEKSITSLEIKTSTQSEVRKANATVIVAVIGVVAVLITGIFNIAPLVFN